MHVPFLRKPITGRRRAATRRAPAFALTSLALSAVGCAVPQPAGQGRLSRVVETRTGRGYWLYLPKDCVGAEGESSSRSTKVRPLVVTFHGMKPFDCAHAQAREWEAEADRYGFIVIAPELQAMDVLGQFPVRSVDRALKSDEEATLAILERVFATTPADRRNVLSTSWSSGGYMAHYMLNRHPDRFTCLAVRQSNFSSSILDSERTPQSLDHPILIVSTEHDFPICKRESNQAVDWYKRHAYRALSWLRLKALGHERTPEVAADFFARLVGVAPSRPSEALVHRQVLDGELGSSHFFTARSRESEDTGYGSDDMTWLSRNDRAGEPRW